MPYKIDWEAIRNAPPVPPEEFLKTLDELAEQNARWIKFKDRALLDFLKEQGFDDPVKNLEQRAQVARRGELERFTGGNWEEFFKWDGVRVLHFSGRPRPNRSGQMVRTVRRLRHG